MRKRSKKRVTVSQAVDTTTMRKAIKADKVAETITTVREIVEAVVTNTVTIIILASQEVNNRNTLNNPNAIIITKSTATAAQIVQKITEMAMKVLAVAIALKNVNTKPNRTTMAATANIINKKTDHQNTIKRVASNLKIRTLIDKVAIKIGTTMIEEVAVAAINTEIENNKILQSMRIHQLGNTKK
jgi:hypothetical protein